MSFDAEGNSISKAIFEETDIRCDSSAINFIASRNALQAIKKTQRIFSTTLSRLHLEESREFFKQRLWLNDQKASSKTFFLTFKSAKFEVLF